MVIPHWLMVLLPWLLLAVVLTAAAAYRGAIGGVGAQREAAKRFARRVGLPVTEPPDAVLQVRLVRRNRLVMVGAAIGLTAPGLLPGGWIEGFGFPAPLLLGVAAGAVLAQLTEPGPAADAPRVAHATDTALTDYVPRWAVGLVALGVAAVAVLTAFAVAVPMHIERGVAPILSPTQVAVLGTGCVLLSAFAFWSARTVVRRRRSVTSAAELAVDDALRAQAVRDCLGLSVATSIGALLVVGLHVDNAAGVSRFLHGWSPLLALAVAAVALTVHEWTGGPRRWRRLHTVPA